MAFMNQERKRELAAELKKVLKDTGLKYSLAVRSHSTIVMTIKSGPVDFFSDIVAERCEAGGLDSAKKRGHLSINPYWYFEHFTGKSKDVLERIVTALNIGNHDRSVVQADYFDVGWYVDVNVGNWSKPYILTK